MKKCAWMICVLCLMMGSVCQAESQATFYQGEWKAAAVLNNTNAYFDIWDDMLILEADGTAHLQRDGQKTTGHWQMENGYASTNLGDAFAQVQWLESDMLLCGSYAQGYLFTRNGEMPAFPQMGSGISEDGFYYRQMADGTLKITGHITMEEDVQVNDQGEIVNLVDLVIPACINDVPVTAVDMSAFYGHLRLRSVVLSEGILHLGREAFNDCVNLESVRLPESLISMGGYVFSYCTKLEQVNIPARVQEIDFNPFTNCTGLETFDLAPENKWYRLENDGMVEVATNYMIAFPAGTEKTHYDVPEYICKVRLAAFMGCENLQYVTLPEGLQELESFVFENTGLVEVNIPSSLTEMDDNPFNNCKALENIDVAQDNNLFSSVDGVLFDKEKERLIYYPLGRTEATYTVPEGTKVIGADAFNRHRKLTTVILPSTVETIGDYAFYKMRALTEMTIPEGVVEMGNYTFCECYALRSIHIPTTVKEIGYCTFGYCEDLQIYAPSGIAINENAFDEAQRITVTYDK